MIQKNWHLARGSGSTWPDCVCEGSEIIARVLGTGYPIGQGWSAESEARARLMVAAPTMLAALYKAQVSLCDAWSPRDKEALRAINEAIETATKEG
jgi:hypothetical protein